MLGESAALGVVSRRLGQPLLLLLGLQGGQGRRVLLLLPLPLQPFLASK
jgi:hypothetical protein